MTVDFGHTFADNKKVLQYIMYSVMRKVLHLLEQPDMLACWWTVITHTQPFTALWILSGTTWVSR